MIIDSINQKIIELYKARESVERTFLQTIKSQIQAKAKDMGKDLEDGETVAVIKGERKKLEQSLDQFKSAGRDDLADKVENEIKILKSYLPEELSDEKIEEIALELKQIGDDFGQLMKKVMERVKGQAGGSKVAQIVKKVL